MLEKAASFLWNQNRVGGSNENRILDAKTIGDDIDLSAFEKLGEVVTYNFSTTEEALERTVDADVIVLNKVEINEHSIGKAKKLKLVCVTATGNKQSG